MSEYTAPVIEGRLQRSQEIQLRRPLKKQFFLGMLTGTSATLYTAPAAPTNANAVGVNPIAVVERVWISNTDASARTVTLYVVESGGSVADNRAVMKTVSIPANSTVDVEPDWVLEASGTLRGLADTTLKVTVLVSGTEYL
jgi:hypothetical protein